MARAFFVKIEGIKGGSTRAGHKDEIDALDVCWGATQNSTFGTGTGGGSGRSEVKPITFVHRVDCASPLLFQKCCTGEVLPSALVTFFKAGPTGPQMLQYFKITLSNVKVGKVHPAARTELVSQSRITVLCEVVELWFTKIELDYQKQSQQGVALGGAVHGGWDLLGNVKA